MENNQTDVKNVTINVMEKIGSHAAVISGQGAIIAELVQQEFNAGHHVTLSFEGITMVLSSFLRTAYGTFLEHHSPEELEQKLTLIDTLESTRELLPYVIKSSIRFYKNPEAYYEAQRIYDAEYYDADEFDDLDTELLEKVEAQSV